MWRKPPVSANSVFQGLGRPEPDGFMGLDGHGLTGAGVAARVFWPAMKLTAA
jgi:hypothetical protein